MAIRHEIRLSRRRLLAVGACVSLVAQMALPALHAVGTADVAARATPIAQEASGYAPVVARADQTPPAHDPATCPVCQSLLRAGPVPSSSVSRAEPCAGRPLAPPAAPVGAPAAIAQVGHPPRAPPASALHLA